MDFNYLEKLSIQKEMRRAKAHFRRGSVSLKEALDRFLSQRDPSAGVELYAATGGHARCSISKKQVILWRMTRHAFVAYIWRLGRHGAMRPVDIICRDILGNDIALKSADRPRIWKQHVADYEVLTSNGKHFIVVHTKDGVRYADFRKDLV